MESNSGSEFPDAWILPDALRQLEECGETVLVEELIEIFQTDTAERLELLGRAIGTADLSTVRAETHTIKGSAMQVGAVRVADVCRQMELEARETEPHDLAPMFRTLLLSFDEFRGVIAAHRGSSTDGSLYHGQ